MLLFQGDRIKKHTILKEKHNDSDLFFTLYFLFFYI